MPGREVPADDIETLWDPWTPAEIADRLAAVRAPWCVAAGWALDLFIGEVSRPHSDLEVAVPALGFAEVHTALKGFEWDVAGDGMLWPYPEQINAHHQTWLRDPTTGRYRVDVFREPHVGERWVCRRDSSITLPYTELIRRAPNGIPYATPDVVLLFKAKHLRPKDIADFDRIRPRLDKSQQARLAHWLSRVHPGHPWIDALTIK